MPQYKYIPVVDVHTSHFNPARRTDRASLTGLLLSIREHGILTPLSLTRLYILADGHRRLAVAKILKLETVPVAVYDEYALDEHQLWVLLNGDTLNLSAAQWLAAVHAGLPLDTPGFPDRIRDRIARLQKLVSRTELDLLVEEGRSPMILDAAERVCRYLGEKNGDEFLKLTLHWLIVTGNAWSIRGALQDEVPPDLLKEAITTNTNIGRVWDMVR
jgi:ParB-like chromosome segregation protein Spo0J